MITAPARITVLRVLAFGLALSALALAAGGRAGAGAGSDLQGDANCSAVVDTVDALTILRQQAGLGTAACAQLADVQCDGDVDAIDALQVLRWGAALSVTQEPGCAEIGQPLGPPPSSHDLIADALADDAIDEETALVYEFYAAFNDPACRANTVAMTRESSRSTSSQRSPPCGQVSPSRRGT